MPVIQETKTLSFKTELAPMHPCPQIIREYEVNGVSLEVHASIRISGDGQTASTEDKFRRLADLWRRQTRHLSFTHQKINGTYLKIIGMGEKALPLILRELVDNSNPFWFIALEAITGQDNPLAEGANVEQVCQAWLTWGKSKGLM